MGSEMCIRDSDDPNKFLDFDIFTKIRVLHQLSTWTLGNADRIRQQMVEQTEREQTSWVSRALFSSLLSSIHQLYNTVMSIYNH